MFKLYYQPQCRWFGDCMPFGRGEKFYLYHQRDSRKPCPCGEPFGWHLSTTSDFVAYEDLGVAIPRGGDEEQDEQYDVERIHVVSFAMGLCHESSKKIATFNAVWNGRGFTGRVPAGGIPPFAGLRACRTFI